MSLDKQSILNELGSVMNKLQSADCGCMGKLFSNQTGRGGGSATAYPGGGCSGLGAYRGGCCQGHHAHHQNHQGFNSSNGGYLNNPCAGEPCMGKCNPRKMYSETYNYLNNNMMQPVVNEVYNDLKSLTTENTVVNNNTMASKMGLAQQRNILSSNTMQMENSIQRACGSNQMASSQNQIHGAHNSNQMSGGIYHNGYQKTPETVSGMGPNIMKMMSSGGNSKPINSMPQNGVLTDQMLIDAPQSPHGKIGVTPLNTVGGMYYNAESGITNNPYRQMVTPKMNYTTGENNFNDKGFNRNNQKYIQQGVNNVNNPTMQQQVPSSNTQYQTYYNGNKKYGMHNEGMKKFNDMFPGVTGTDLGFDPMAIAIQMNPQNHKKAAMDTINKMMSGNKGHLNKLSAGAVAQPQQIQEHMHAPNQQCAGDNTVPINNTQIQQHQQVYYNQANPQQPLCGQYTPHAVSHLAADPNNQPMQGLSQAELESQRQFQDPIYPADKSKTFSPSKMQFQKFHQYNTLGQPIELHPAEGFHSTPVVNLPQTLYPQPPSGKLRKDISKLNIKSTVSKTSLMGNKPNGNVPSKSHLQNIYYQYKGSHSNTHQASYPTRQSVSHSEGKLGSVVEKVAPSVQTTLVEKMGGDTTINQPDQIKPPGNETVQERGDTPQVNKSQDDSSPVMESPKPRRNTRNGLQDQVFTSYQASAAWSFHGDGGVPYRGQYRGYRTRV